MSGPLPRVHASIVAMLNDTAAAFSERAALVQGDSAMSYEEMRRCVGGMARLILEQDPAGDPLPLAA